MFSPTDSAPASRAPRLAASIEPGPPPVITARPRSPSRRPTSRASAYSGESTGVRAEPNTETPRPTSDIRTNATASSSRMRSRRSSSARTVSTSRVSAPMISSSEVRGRCGSGVPIAGTLALRRLEPGGVTYDVATRAAPHRLPARARLRAAAGVEAQARDHHVGVARVRVDRHPLPRATLAEGLELRGVARPVEQARAVQRIGDRARAVVAGVVPRSMAAAVAVGRLRDLVAGGNDRLDLLGRAGRRGGRAVAVHARARAGGQHGRLGRRRGHVAPAAVVDDLSQFREVP